MLRISRQVIFGFISLSSVSQHYISSVATHCHRFHNMVIDFIGFRFSVEHTYNCTQLHMTRGERNTCWKLTSLFVSVSLPHSAAEQVPGTKTATDFALALGFRQIRL